MPIQALPHVLLLGLLFGSTLIASRFSVGQFSPTTYIGLRLTIASVGHVAVYALHRRQQWPTDPRLWRRATLLGMVGTAIPMTLIVTSLQYQSSGITSLLITVGPAVTVLLAHCFLPDETLTTRKALGVALALGGALLLLVRGESGLADLSRANPLGYGMVFLAILVGSSMTVYARRALRHYDAFDVASIRMLAAALAVTPLSLLLVGFDLHKVDSRGYFALGYAAIVGTFAGMMLAFYVLKRFGATASAMTQYVVPVVTSLGGVLILDERITTGMLAGMAIIGLGIALLNYQKRRPPEPV